MIIGTSHISVSTFNIQKDIEEFCNSGFTLSFLDQHIENNIEKKPYLKKYSSLHSIAVLSGKSGIDLELVEHQRENTDTKNQNIDVVFEGGSVKQIEYRVQKPEESLHFWQEFMGFSLIQSENTFSVLEKKSMVPKWNCNVKLTRTEVNYSEPMVDHRGATSFAFFTTNLGKAMDTFQNNYDLFGTKIFQLNINNKALEIAILSGPSKEIIELIQIKK